LVRVLPGFSLQHPKMLLDAQRKLDDVMEVAWFMDGDVIALSGDLCQVSCCSGLQEKPLLLLRAITKTPLAA